MQEASLTDAVRRDGTVGTEESWVKTVVTRLMTEMPQEMMCVILAAEWVICSMVELEDHDSLELGCLGI